MSTPAPPSCLHGAPSTAASLGSGRRYSSYSGLRLLCASGRRGERLLRSWSRRGERLRLRRRRCEPLWSSSSSRRRGGGEGERRGGRVSAGTRCARDGWTAAILFKLRCSVCFVVVKMRKTKCMTSGLSTRSSNVKLRRGGKRRDEGKKTRRARPTCLRNRHHRLLMTMIYRTCLGYRLLCRLSQQFSQ